VSIPGKERLTLPIDFSRVVSTHGAAGNDSAPAFITVGGSCTLKGVVIFYPEQTGDQYPAAYPWSISMEGDNAAVMDLELLNSYNGILAQGAGRHYIARVQGQPTNIGVYVDAIYDIGRIEDVHFNPWWVARPFLVCRRLSHWFVCYGQVLVEPDVCGPSDEIRPELRLRSHGL
jgi:hypothetical protein